MQIDEDMASLMDALMPHVPFDGWTEKSLRAALTGIGQAPEDAKLLFPGGAGEMIEAFFALANTRLEQAAAEADLSPKRVPARVRAIITLWLEQNRGNREAIRRALSWLTLPTHTRRTARITAAMADSIWFAAGDTSTDFSWYTKRATLVGILGTMLLYWLNDTSENNENTLNFLDRRLDGVARIGKLRKRIESRLPEILPPRPGA